MMDNLLQRNNPEVPSLESLQSFIRRWNYLYPVDRWYRQKYNIAFGSNKHHKVDVLAMRMDYEEDVMYATAQAKEVEKILANRTYEPGRGQWLMPQKQQELTKEEVDKAFDDIDITQIQQNQEGNKDVIII